jgi:hypothetical protein
MRSFLALSPVLFRFALAGGTPAALQFPALAAGIALLAIPALLAALAAIALLAALLALAVLLSPALIFVPFALPALALLAVLALSVCSFLPSRDSVQTLSVCFGTGGNTTPAALDRSKVGSLPLTEPEMDRIGTYDAGTDDESPLWECVAVAACPASEPAPSAPLTISPWASMTDAQLLDACKKGGIRANRRWKRETMVARLSV